jgi:hypothetical protein
MKVFRLIGGPVDSCALGGSWLRFEKGEKLFLFLEDPVPASTKAIQIFRAPRVYRGRFVDLLSLRWRVRDAWSRRVELLRELAPDEMGHAPTIAAYLRTGVVPAKKAVEAASYPTLLRTAELLRDPTSPLPRPDIVREPLTMGSPFTNEPRPKEPTTYLASWTRSGLPVALSTALSARQKTRPDEVRAFQERLLRLYLVEDLLVPEDLAGRFVKAIDSFPSEALPFRWLKLRTDAPADLAPILSLMRFADVEDDWLVKGGGSCPSDAALFAPWLARHADEVPLRRDHLKVCLSLEHRAAAPVIRRAVEIARSDRWLEEYLAFFRAIGDEAGLALVEARRTALAAEKR